MRVIIGYSEQKNGQEKANKPSFLPKPPNGGQAFEDKMDPIELKQITKIYCQATWK